MLERKFLFVPQNIRLAVEDLGYFIYLIPGCNFVKLFCASVSLKKGNNIIVQIIPSICILWVIWEFSGMWSFFQFLDLMFAFLFLSIALNSNNELWVKKNKLKQWTYPEVYQVLWISACIWTEYSMICVIDEKTAREA